MLGWEEGDQLEGGRGPIHIFCRKIGLGRCVGDGKKKIGWGEGGGRCVGDGKKKIYGWWGQMCRRWEEEDLWVVGADV